MYNDGLHSFNSHCVSLQLSQRKLKAFVRRKRVNSLVSGKTINKLILLLILYILEGLNKNKLIISYANSILLEVLLIIAR